MCLERGIVGAHLVGEIERVRKARAADFLDADAQPQTLAALCELGSDAAQRFQ